jgi:phage terminase large subunit-like protein
MPTKAEILHTLEAQVKARRENRLASFQLYAKQREFIALGGPDAGSLKERLFLAGNQCGKSQCGAYEMAAHLTGAYPPDWPGKRFDGPVDAWVAGEGGQHVRDVIQAKLIGGLSEYEIGTGLIPKAAIVGKTLGHGVSGLLDSLAVKHVSGGISTLGFKSYDQGRGKFQGKTLRVVWCDEEPPSDIYSESIARLTGDGIIYTTCTPLLGPTEFIQRFTEFGDKNRGFVTMGLEHALHFTAEERQARIDAFPAHERSARANGTPMLGSGSVFPGVTEESLYVDMPLSSIQKHWGLLWGIDFGIAHPYGAVLCAYDRDRDCIYVIDCFKVSNATPREHAHRMQTVAPFALVAWPHDGEAREHGTGEPLAAQYKKMGLRMLPGHSAYPDGNFQTEAGIQDMWQRMKDGRLKVNRHLTEWFSEFRTYHRKNDNTGQIVKVFDDLMSATRMAVMSTRKAEPAELAGANNPWFMLPDPRRNRVTQRPPLNPFTGQHDYGRDPYGR